MPDLLKVARQMQSGPVRAAISALCIVMSWSNAEAGPSADGSTGRAITVATWGGPYQYSQEKAYFEPFTKMSGIDINIDRYDGGLAELRRQVGNSETNGWDLVDMTMADNRAACKQGLLERIDHGILPPAPDGTQAEQDFIDGALTECGVSQIVYAMIIAYNRDAFPGDRPTRIEDLFDLERFPGARSLQKGPEANLEWALRSYGVPREDLYQSLSTRRGLWLAFERLEDIREHVRWWTSVSTPLELLVSGEVTMASVYNGRAFDAAVIQGHPVEIIWDAQIYELGAWGIPKGTRNLDEALEFIRFATGTQPLADQTKYIPYGPARRSSMKLVSTHAETGMDIRQHLPTYPVHFGTAILKDTEWYASLHDRIKVRFDRWLTRQ
ncbi:MAG: ABC transporter substrate-binding protein [Boseongicola sp. SB0675_bin_26]|nr:ABC transporter substrate-binding protein [Boseongicola sp. SB0675_bin_26]